MSSTVPCYKSHQAKQVLLKESGDLVRIMPFFEQWCESEDPSENTKLERVVELLSSAWYCAQYCVDHGVRCRGGRGGGRPPRFWRKIFQYIPPPPQILAGFVVKCFNSMIKFVELRE